jgi:hypothetical protein
MMSPTEYVCLGLPFDNRGVGAKNQQLDILGELAAPPAYEQLQQRGERAIDEGKDHLPMLPEPQPQSHDPNAVLKPLSPLIPGKTAICRHFAAGY